MSEIEKMYENAGVKLKYSGWLDMGDLDTQMTYIQCDTKEEWNECVLMARSSYSSDDENYNKPKIDYPPFTAEKQLELIKWLAQYNFVACKNLGGWHTGLNPTYDEDFGITCNKRATNFGSFEYALAGIINNIWQSLTEEEKQQVKGILE